MNCLSDLFIANYKKYGHLLSCFHFIGEGGLEFVFGNILLNEKLKYIRSEWLVILFLLLLEVDKKCIKYVERYLSCRNCGIVIEFGFL